MNEFISIQEACKRLGRSRSTINRMIKDGRLTANKLGREVRLHAAEVDELAKTGTVSNFRQKQQGNHESNHAASVPFQISSGDLDGWGKGRLAEMQFPELIKRLLIAEAKPAGIKELHIPHGDAVNSKGVDGYVVAETGTYIVPSGISYWELGVNQDAKRKFKDDYKNRTEKVDETQRKETTFAFATPHNFPDLVKTAEEYQGRNEWKGVVILDCNKIADWLSALPGPRTWFLEKLGRPHEPFCLIESYWNRWSNETRPKIYRELLISDRQDCLHEIQQYLNAESGKPLLVQADTQEEGVVFVCAAIMSDSQLAEKNSIIVLTEGGIDELASVEGDLIVVTHLNSANPKIGKLLDNGLQVIVCQKHNAATSELMLVIPKSSRHALEAILRRYQEIDDDRASKLAFLGANDFSLLYQKLLPVVPNTSTVPRELRKYALILSMFGEVNTSNEKDVRMIAEVLQQSFEAVEERLHELCDNHPEIVQIRQGIWYAINKDEVINNLLPSVSQGLMQRFMSAAHTILSDLDPLYGLSSTERIYRQIKGDIPLRSSRNISKGVARTAALLSTMEDIALKNKVNPVAVSQEISQFFFEMAEKDSTCRAWGSFEEELMYLAEANPSAFIDSLRKEITANKGKFPELFAADSSDPFESAHRGIYLLWALEIVAWNKDYLYDVAIIIAELSKIEVPINQGNAPISSLIKLFRIVRPQTSADSSTRRAIIAKISKEYPDQAESFLEGIMPENSFVLSEVKPTFHAWHLSLTQPSITDIQDEALDVLMHMICLAKRNSPYWQSVLEVFKRDAMLDHRDVIICGLEELLKKEIPAEDKSIIYDLLFSFVDDYVAFGDSPFWKIDKKQLEKLSKLRNSFAPADQRQKTINLFSYAHRSSSSSGRSVVTDEMKECILSIYGEDGITGIIELSNEIENKWMLGTAVAETLASSDISDEDIVELATQGSKEGPALSALQRMLRIVPRERVISVCLSQKKEEALTSYLIHEPLSEENIALMSTFGKVNQKRYWQSVSPYEIDSVQGLTEFVSRLGEHKRAACAVLAAGNLTRREEQSIPTATIENILRALTKYGLKNDEEVSYEDILFPLEQLVDELESRTNVDSNSLIEMEWSLSPILLSGSCEPKALYLGLEINPELFFDIVSMAYPVGNSILKGIPKEQRDRLAESAYRLLERWSGMPGCSEDAINVDELNIWFDDAFTLFDDQNKTDVFSRVIGKQFVHSPKDAADGAWPALAIRDLLERYTSDVLIRNICIGVFNNGGLITRSQYDTGNFERSQAKRYKDYLDKIGIEHRQTKKVLEGIIKSYDHSASRMKEQAENEDMFGHA